MELSVIVPVYKEEDNIKPMIDAIASALDNKISYEVIFVDDGSLDNTVKNILKYSNEKIKLVTFKRNYGQTPAMAAGIEYAKGKYIAFLDGDLQNDPADIPAMIKKLEEEDLDVVAGWRKNRKDKMIMRKIPSKCANYLIRWMTGVHIHDYGCSLKVFKSELAKDLDLYGELHRFIPILAVMSGGKIAEVVVNHSPRKFGTTKYGISRTIRVLSDLMLMLFFLRYRQRPMHLFGSLGILMFGFGALIESYLLFIKLMFGEDIGGRPLFYIGILLLIMSMQFITTGFVSELVMRIYHDSGKRKPYAVKKIYMNGKESEEK